MNEDSKMSSLTSMELNYLVFRYLHESGFTHSAFAFGYEAAINRCPIDGSLVPPGALVKFVQKGLQYLEMEANLTNTEADMDEDFSFLQPLDLITKDLNELQNIVKDKMKIQQQAKEKELEREHELALVRLKDKEKRDTEKEQETDKERMDEEKPREIPCNDQTEKQEMVIDKGDAVNDRGEENGNTAVGPEPMIVSMTSQPREIPSSDVTILDGHTSEVCACAWNPSAPLLASGSGDSTARIWKVADGASGSGLQEASPSVLVLKHVKSKTNEASKDVTALDWNGDGTLLATGSYDGHARIWSSDGELKGTLIKHKGPIFSLKWNKRGDSILTGSCDKSAIVWDVKTLEWKQQFEFHSGPALDVDWRNNNSFATCSTDHMIYVCKVGETRPIRTFSDHKGEVNCVKWDATGSLLASCSDDTTAKIWNMRQDKYIYDLKGHCKEIYTIRWSPTGPGTNNPNQSLMLASASFDSTVKIWDVDQGRLVCTLHGHRDPVYSVAFSPNGQYLVSGSLDRSLLIWSLKDGKVIKRYTGDGGIFEVCWNKEGDKIAACFANKRVCVLNFRM